MARQLVVAQTKIVVLEGVSKSKRYNGGASSHLRALEPFPSEEQPSPTQSADAPALNPTTTVAPTPTPPQPPRPSFAVPERPQSPTLCKFSLKCTNAQCRWSHPSPVATPESGVVLSNEPCEKGKDCKDKDCIKGHVSPAAVNPALGMCLWIIRYPFLTLI